MKEKPKKKYALIGSDIEGLSRVMAIMDFNDVKHGQIGGYVESEKNLSQHGECWIYDNAKAVGNSRVSGDATIHDNVKLCENARVYQKAHIFENAVIEGNARIFGNAVVTDRVHISGNTNVGDYVCIFDDCDISGMPLLYGTMSITGKAKITSDMDYFVFKIGTEYVTYTKSDNMWHFDRKYMTEDELLKYVEEANDEYKELYPKYIEFVRSLIKT